MLSIFLCLAVNLLIAGTPRSAEMRSAAYPWVYPGDFNERIAHSEIVVSGTIVSTLRSGSQTVDGVKLTQNTATINVDRVFKGSLKARDLKFLWYTFYAPSAASDYGFVYSGPPLADFRPGTRYLVFLRAKRNVYEVTIPVYGIEAKLAAPRSPSMFPDLSAAPSSMRNGEIAIELETAALSFPDPPENMTGEAATYFPYVVDLIGGCAEPFLWHFVRKDERLDRLARQTELRTAAQRWLALIANKGMSCTPMTREEKDRILDVSKPADASQRQGHSSAAKPCN